MRSFIIFSIFLLWISCNSTKTNSNFQNLDNLSWAEDSNSYACNFAIQHHAAHTRILVFKDKTRKDTLGKLYQGSFLNIPLDYVLLNGQKLACLSSVYAGFVDALNASQQIEFVDETDFIYSKRLRNLIDSGKIKECGTESDLNFELLTQQKPLVFTYEIDGQSNAVVERMKKLKIPFLICNDFRETHPLGRAEWLKVFGFICNREQESTQLFDEIVLHYESTVYFCQENIKNKPTVFSGAMFGGNWNVSGGNTFIAQFINHAGGIYVFENDSIEGNKLMTFENFYIRCKDADVWLNPNHYHTLQEIKSEDNRYDLFKAYKNKRVYNNNRLINQFGGNAYWEMGVVRPDIVLKDLLICLHPYFFENEKPIFYQHLD